MVNHKFLPAYGPIIVKRRDGTIDLPAFLAKSGNSKLAWCPRCRLIGVFFPESAYCSSNREATRLIGAASHTGVQLICAVRGRCRDALPLAARSLLRRLVYGCAERMVVRL